MIQPIADQRQVDVGAFAVVAFGPGAIQDRLFYSGAVSQPMVAPEIYVGNTLPQL